jgi:predicted enzyme related to lactoylglutathione lyase
VGPGGRGAGTGPRGGEIDFTVEDAAAVDATHAAWAKAGRKIAQAPTDMDFGRTFVALDPDGHRLRVLAAPAS